MQRKDFLTSGPWQNKRWMEKSEMDNVEMERSEMESVEMERNKVDSGLCRPKLTKVLNRYYRQAALMERNCWHGWLASVSFLDHALVD